MTSVIFAPNFSSATIISGFARSLRGRKTFFPSRQVPSSSASAAPSGREAVCATRKPWAAARVTTMRLPASTDLPGSITLPAHLCEDFAGAGVPEEFGDLMAEFAGLVGRSRLFFAQKFLAVG